MLENDGVAEHKIRTSEPRHLIVRVIPRHHADQRADRQVPDERRARRSTVNRLVGKELGGMIGIVFEDLRREFDLDQRLVHQFAHLVVDDGGELLLLVAIRRHRLAHQRRALLDGRGPPPRAVCFVGGIHRRGDLLVGEGFKAFLDLSGRRIGHCISAHRVAFRCHTSRHTHPERQSRAFFVARAPLECVFSSRLAAWYAIFVSSALPQHCEMRSADCMTRFRA